MLVVRYFFQPLPVDIRRGTRSLGFRKCRYGTIALHQLPELRFYGIWFILQSVEAYGNVFMIYFGEQRIPVVLVQDAVPNKAYGWQTVGS